MAAPVDLTPRPTYLLLVDIFSTPIPTWRPIAFALGATSVVPVAVKVVLPGSLGLISTVAPSSVDAMKYGDKVQLLELN
jgi:hypothetical protein